MQDQLPANQQISTVNSTILENSNVESQVFDFSDEGLQQQTNFNQWLREALGVLEPAA